MRTQRTVGRANPLLCCLAVLLSTALLGACGETYIQLTADKTEISAGGTDFATLTVKVFVEDEAKGQAKVSFTTTSGSFNGDLLSPEQTKDVATDSSGTATIKLYSDSAPGQATVTAEFYDDATGLSATQTISVVFTKAAGGLTPVDGKLRLTCDAVNIGALRVPVPDIKVTCNLTAQARNGTAIPSSALEPAFRSEAGAVTIETDSYTQQRIFLYSPKSGASAPKDVPPDPAVAEPVRNDNTGLERNPRDGLATIIAIVDGEEAFTDVNGNGEYDQGEPFVDAAEPWVDANDNDKHDPGEEFIDLNGNNTWDAGNGQWDAKTKIMAMFKILWTGALHSSPETSRLGAVTTNIFDSGKLEIRAYALDANMNPIAAFQQNSDYLEWTLSSSGDALSNDATTPALSNAYGFQFDTAANSERKRWKILPNSFEPPDYTFTVEDGYPGDQDPATNFKVSAKVFATPGQSGGGYYLTQLTEKIDESIEGTCD
jgi:hypothetical protein